jgi:3',5'-cyclic AMP phosphodiesterase CpdA
MKFAILHISDMHFGRRLKSAESGFGRRMLGISEHSYPLCVSLSNEVMKLRKKYGTALIVAVTGDQTTSSNAAAHEVAANFLKGRCYVSSRVQVGLNLQEDGHIVPGNHDMFLTSPLTQRSRREVYAHYFPSNFPTWTVCAHGSGFATVFCLDSNLVSGFNPFNFRNLNKHGEVGVRQRSDLLVLREYLSAATTPTVPAGYNYDDSFKVVLLHHHLVKLKNGKGGSQLKDHKDLIQVLENMGIDLVLCGHEHVPFHQKVGNLKPFSFSCAGSTTQQNVLLNSFKVYHVDPGANSIEMELFTASDIGGLLTFVAQPKEFI